MRLDHVKMLEKGIAANQRGEVWLDLIRVPEDLSDDTAFTPLTTELVVVKMNGRFLLAFTPGRQNWEIPGGHIEPGETPRLAAARELLEETGQKVENLVFEGINRCRLPVDSRVEYSALFSTELPSLEAFSGNAEISRITLWDQMQDIGRIDAIDAALLKHLSQSTPASLPAVADDGSRILDFQPAPPAVDSTIKFTQIMAAYRGRYLLVYDNTRDHWEFPAGGIEKGESWRECAIRETREESGQTLCQPRLAAIIRAYFPRRKVIAAGALVTGSLTELKPFEATSEISRIRLWDPRSEESGLDAYNLAIFERLKGFNI